MAILILESTMHRAWLGLILPILRSRLIWNLIHCNWLTGNIGPGCKISISILRELASRGVIASVWRWCRN